MTLHENLPKNDKRATLSLDQITAPHSPDAELVKVLDDYVESLKTGSAPSHQDLLDQHPEIADELRAYLESITRLHFARENKDAPKALGDFRLVRQVGRGGMGTVYEAIQVSLDRRVAVKVLDHNPATNRKATERFAREASTIASLHHTNIVPIFYVGNELETEYYAMQYIDGSDLSQVLKSQNGPLPPDKVTKWALQAADALQHAHQRGVIHRDVKPSNLILDVEGRLWLTDFGLARRHDDVCLSITGMLLGTPKYMSPEQARPSHSHVDHRSDLFSLGATLYELLTGRPPFAGEATHELISNILLAEPTPIRHHNPAVPKDLETVVLKCLEKAPESRYQSAADLSRDLQAIMDGRPIQAKRASSLQLTARWIKQNRQALSFSALAAVATITIFVTGLLLFKLQEDWNLSGVRLDATNPPLVAEFFNSQGVLQSTQTLPMQKPVGLPADDYNVTVSGPGAISQNYGLELLPGFMDNQYTLSLSDDLLQPPVPIESNFGVADLGSHFKQHLDSRQTSSIASKKGIVSWFEDRSKNERGLQVQMLSGPVAKWTLTTEAIKREPALQPFPDVTLPQTFSTQHTNRGPHSISNSPWILTEPMDVNDDGVGDFIIAAKHQAWVMAVSGNGRGVLWFAGLSEELSAPKDASHLGLRSAASSIPYEPLRIEDIDDDGQDDFVLLCVNVQQSPSITNNQYVCRRQIQALSSHSGKILWKRELEQELFDLPANQVVPQRLRWLPHDRESRFSTGNNYRVNFGKTLRTPEKVSYTGPHAYLPTRPAILPFNENSPIAVVAGQSLLVLDCKSGELLNPMLSLPFRPGAEVSWHDLDADDYPEMVWTEELLNPLDRNQIDAKVGVWSLKFETTAWSKSVDAYYPYQQPSGPSLTSWPYVVDLQNDGSPEVLVPNGRSHDMARLRLPGFEPDFTTGSISCLNAITGDVIWTRELPSVDGCLERFVTGPDINQDGCNDVLVASFFGDKFDLYIDALSGSTGERLWSTRKALLSDDSVRYQASLSSLLLWQSYEDGFPQLVATVDYFDSGRAQSELISFSCANGRLLHFASGLSSPTQTDFDDDGCQELVVLRNPSRGSSSTEREVLIIRGISEQPWRRIGDLGEPVVDVDGDQVLDLVRSWGDGTLTATSGRNGRCLWRNQPVSASSPLRIYAGKSTALSGAIEQRFEKNKKPIDVNGDGYDDFFVCHSHTSGRSSKPLHAISGKTGRLIWSVDEPVVSEIANTISLSAMDLDRDGKREILWFAALARQESQTSIAGPNQPPQLWLNVYDEYKGKRKWSRRCSPESGGLASISPQSLDHLQMDSFCTVDCNADGVTDLIVPSIKDDGSLVTHAVDGSTGDLLWTRDHHKPEDGGNLLETWSPPNYCDLTGDGTYELVLIEPTVLSSNNTASGSTASGRPEQLYFSVSAVRASDGRSLWSHQTEYATEGKHRTKSAKQFSRPAIGRHSNGSSYIAVGLPNAETGILILDADGKELLQLNGLQTHDPQFCWLDVNFDDTEDLLYMDGGKLRALSVAPESLQSGGVELWSVEVGELPEQRMLGFFASKRDGPPDLVVSTDWMQNRVLGIDVTSGAVAWSCPGPIAMADFSGRYIIPETIALLGRNGGGLPFFYFQYGFNNTVRGSAPAGNWPAPRRVINEGSQISSVSITPNEISVNRDPRWKRQLPWLASFAEVDVNLIKFYVAASYFSIFLVLLPYLYVLKLLSRKVFSLNYLLMLPLITVLALQALVITLPPTFGIGQWYERVMAGIALTPPIIAFVAIGYALLQQRWKVLWMILFSFVSVSVGAALVCIIVDQSVRPCAADEYYDMNGWYLIGFPIAYVGSWLFLFTLAANRLTGLIAAFRKS